MTFTRLPTGRRAIMLRIAYAIAPLKERAIALTRNRVSPITFVFYRDFMKKPVF
ncbi:hypothetical protein LAY57_23450 [Argonema antarcticum A004/B2]|nr:hypothetical protein [Argonema antarcticum A004/B2]